jgi:hypothetical protein
MRYAYFCLIASVMIGGIAHFVAIGDPKILGFVLSTLFCALGFGLAGYEIGKKARQPRIEELEKVCHEGSQAVAQLLIDVGQYGSPRGQCMIHNLATTMRTFDKLLPWPVSKGPRFDQAQWNDTKVAVQPAYQQPPRSEKPSGQTAAEIFK